MLTVLSFLKFDYLSLISAGLRAVGDGANNLFQCIIDS